MTTTTYKGYTIQIVGLSHHIYRPKQDPKEVRMSPGYAQSMAAAKRWINQDLVKQNESAYSGAN